MIYYLMVLGAAVSIAAVFVLNKIYQNKVGTSMSEAVKKNIPTAFVTAALFFSMAGFKFRFNAFTLLMAAILAVLFLVSVLVCYKGYAKGSISLFTMFQMQGGMLLPFIYGIFYGNNVSPFAIIGIIVMILSLIIPFFREKQSFSIIFILLCGSVFFINGGVSIGSYIFSNSPNGTSIFDFLVLNNLISGIFSIVLYAVMRRKYPKQNNEGVVADSEVQNSSVQKNSVVLWLLIVSSAILNGISFYLQLVGAVHLPAVALYPMITGGTVIFTTLAGLFIFKEKLNIKSIVGILLTFAATILFVF